MYQAPTVDLSGLVLERIAERPEDVAIEEGALRLTYAELDAASAGVAAGLREAGVGAEEVVGICLPRSARAVVAFLGAIRAGAAYVPVGAEHPPARQRQLLELAGVRLVLADPGTDIGVPAGCELLDPEALAALPGGEEPELGDPDRLAYVLFTSGSTGSPKGVEITHANLLNLFANDALPLPAAGDIVLAVAPIEFDLHALECWGALAVGGRLVLAPPGRPDPLALGRLIADRGVSFAHPSAGLFEQLARVALPELGGLRLLASGGDVISPAAARAVRDAHPGLRLLNDYGPTETTISAVTHEIEAIGDGRVPIGRALPGYRLHVLDSEGRLVEPGEPGELWIGGEGVARGYRGDPELTRSRFRPDPFVAEAGARMYGTGDLVRWREDGELLFLGRLDDQVKLAGHRVEPGEVEQALGAHPEVAQAAVVAREDVAGHKRLLAYATRRAGAATRVDELHAHLASRLPKYMLPASIQILPELPLTDRGKLDRAALPAPERAAQPRPAVGRAAAVAELMAEVLELEEVGAEEDFFALGADSLLAIQLVGRLRDRLGVETPIGAVFDAPTPALLASRLGTERAVPRPPLRRHDVGDGPPPATFAQRRAWLFEQLNPDSIAYQFAAILHFEGELDEAALRGALADLIERHAALRSGLEVRGGELVQVVRENVSVPLEIVDLPGRRGLEWARLVRSRVRTRIQLDRAPPVRWTLVRFGPTDCSLIHVEHHVAHDGWSFTRLVSELAELYSARVEGRAATLPELAVELGDFAHWERELANGELGARQLDYWRRALDPEPPLIELPGARPRPPRESFAGGSMRRPVPAELAAAVRDFAREERATNFMAGLAAFATLLGRCGGVEAVQIGSGLANRRDPAAERLIGMTVETVALRLDLSGDPTPRQLLRWVRATVLDALGNSDVPFERVVEAVAPPRRADRSPLLQTLFSFDDAPSREPRWSGLDATLVRGISNGTAKADLNVIGVDHVDHDPYYMWEYSSLIDRATADRLAGHHLHLLREFVAHPDTPLSELDLLSGAEQDELRGWSAGGGEFDRTATVPELVERQARRTPEATAILDGSERLSYGELIERARRIAAALRRHGVGGGDAVGVLLPRSAGAAVAQLGTMLADAAYVPLDPAHPGRRIGRALEDAGAAFVLTQPELVELLPLDIEALDLAVIASGDGAPDADEAGPSPDDLAYLMYTSGSTGVPKGVEVTHGNVVRLVDAPDFADFGPGTVTLHAASPAFDATTLELWGPLANGGTVAVLAEQPSPDAVAAAIADHGVTTLWLTAGLFHELVDRRPDCLASVRHLLAGGDVLSPAHVARALAALPPDGRLTNGYGPTETTTFALTHELRPGDRVGASVPIGRPIQGTVCEVLDPAGRRVPVGFPGELWIGGAGVARGYRGDPELTATRFLPDPERPGGRRYRSGDRVRRRANGAIEFLGRIDRQLKVRGVRVEPAEVEEVLRSHPGVTDVAVAPYETPNGELALAAYPVAPPGGEVPAAGELRLLATMALPAAMVPSAWVPLSELPLGATGKVDRDRLPVPGREHLGTAPEAAERPREGRETTVAAIFERVLGIEGIGAEDDFFALGGHSLLAVALFAELEAETGRRLPLATIFEAATPRALAARLGSEAPQRWDNLVALKPFGSRPPLFAVTAGDGNVAGFGPLAAALDREQPLYALQPSGLDGHAAIDRGVEAMASRCVAELRAVQPHGPYLLAGRCNGATVAYEIAQQLRQAGEPVPLLVSLDSDPPLAGPSELEPGAPVDPFMEAAWLRARAAGEAAPDPEDPASWRELATWLREEEAPGVTRYAHEVWRWREDLRRRWPEPLGADAAALGKWTWESGVAEHDLAAPLLAPAPWGECRVPGGHRWDWALAAFWEGEAGWTESPLGDAGWRRLRVAVREPLGAGANRYLAAAATRPDLATAFPDPLGADLDDFLVWAWSDGVEQGLAPELLPSRPAWLPRRARLRLALQPLRRPAERFVSAATAEQLAARRDVVVDRAEALTGRTLPRARQRLEARIVAAARRARAVYRAEPWPGRVVLVTSPEHAEKPAYLAWERRAATVERRPLPLGHIEMLREGGATDLARLLDACIAEALGA